MISKHIFILFYLLPVFANAQITEQVTIKAGEDAAAVLSEHGLYLFSDFKLSTVTFKDGHNTKAKMNFNVYMNEIQFIADNRDTLIFAQPELIDSILFDSATFYYDKGYRQLIDGDNGYKLVLNRKISFEYIKKGAFGRPVDGSSVEAVGTAVSPFTSSKKMIANEDIVATKNSFYLLLNDKHKQMPASLSGFQAAFPEKKKEIKEFAGNNMINYKKEADLVKLFRFCIQHS